MRSGSRVLVEFEAGRELHVLALKREAREYKHRVLLQKCGAECELHVWFQQHYLSLCLLMASLTSSSMISIPLGSQELLRTPCKLSLLSLGRSLEARLASAPALAMSKDIGFAGLLRDVIASHVGSTGCCQTLKRGWANLLCQKVHGLLYEKSPKRIEYESWDFGANGARREKLLELFLVELDDERFDRWSEKFEVNLRYGLLISGENYLHQNRHLLFGGKNRSKILWLNENYNGSNSNYRRGGVSVDLPFV